MKLRLRFHETELSVCMLESAAPVPVEVLAHPFAVFLRTPGESTLVCPSEMAPENIRKEIGWIALELVGSFDFSLTGILNQVTVPLAAAGISIFALSSFDTDYILIKSDKKTQAMEALNRAGHTFI